MALGAHLTAGQEHEAPNLEGALDGVILPYAGTEERFRPEALAGDKGYSAGWIREWLGKLGIQPVIPHRDNEKPKADEAPLDREAYRKRNIIERLVGWLKECRRIGTRFEKLALNYLAMLKLAMIERCLKVHLSDTA